jgi:superfamily II DNA or RNA helicase
LLLSSDFISYILSKMTIGQLIAKYHRRPALYIIRGDERSADWQGVQKIGTSASIPFRKNNWKTCSRYPVHFQYIFFLDPVTLPESGLYSLDGVILPAWLKLRDEWTTFHVYDGGGDEFYQFADPVAAMRGFLEEQGIGIVEELASDPFPFPCSPVGHEKDLQEEIAAQEAVRTEDNHRRLTEALCKKQFLRQFGIQALRRNQEELWEIWATTLTTATSYKGIVQWPTGTGKTFAMLILILQLHMHMREKGEVYRGILVAPQNAILDTLMKHICRLKCWGLEVLDGTNAKFSTLTIPKQKPFLIVATHAAIAGKGLDRFAALNHIHYDEVHRITGDEFYESMMEKLAAWNIPHITGTSATPKTANPKQHEKLARLFGTGEPLHRVTVEEAVKAGWIAHPHFKVVTVEGEGAAIPGFLHEIKALFTAQTFRHAKAIIYFDEIAQVVQALRYAPEIWPAEWRLFKAIDTKEDVGLRVGTDTAFVASEPTGIPQILFSCDRYREGSDIPGVDAVAYLMGRTTAAHIIEQIVGRAMRMDYEGKVATCLLVRPRFAEEGEDAVMDTVKLTVDTMFPTSRGRYNMTDRNTALWNLEFKGVGEWLSTEESLLRMQYWYLREEYSVRKLDLTAFASLIRTGQLKPLEQTYTSLKTNNYYPANFKNAWGMSYYDAIEGICPGSTEAIRAWGTYPCTFYTFLKEQAIADVFDYEARWMTLRKEGYGIPGIPTEIWGEHFWHIYSEQMC